ncbi:MAG: hypothetical protein ACJ8DX_04740 [Xanthobacteraceae bacterium]
MLNLLAKASLVLIALISLFMTIGNYRAHPSGPGCRTHLEQRIVDRTEACRLRTPGLFG